MPQNKQLRLLEWTVSPQTCQKYQGEGIWGLLGAYSGRATLPSHAEGLALVRCLRDR